MPDNTQVYFPCYTWINHSKLYFGQPRVLFTNDVRISLALSHMHIYKHNYATSVTKMSHKSTLIAISYRTSILPHNNLNS
jgi:hypothetical protein